MMKNKYLLMAGLATALASSPALAQESQTNSNGANWSGRDMTYRGESYDVLDSSYVPGGRMDQHRKYLNHQNAFPAKPRSMWEVGVHGGLYNISGDVPSRMLWDKGGFGFGAHVRKALGYIVSLRLDYTYGIGKGLSYQASRGFSNNPAWNGVNFGLNPGTGPYTTPVGINETVFYNYKTEAHQASLDVVASLGNILFHKTRPVIDPYLFAGIAGHASQTWVNALNENFQGYTAGFNSIAAEFPGQPYEDRKDIKDRLDDLLDDSYETRAETDADIRRPSIFDSKKLSFATTFGFGMQFRLSKRINLALEDRITFFPTTNEDLLDGQRWAEQPGGSPVFTQSKDGINYLSLGLNVNLGNAGKNVEPLYWLNPLDHSYNELSNPRHMILPDPVLPDADGDGITDQFDRCPGTPAGVAVDSHGCPMDTDGDGVPDDRDKQLITPTYCQPVDADGVGNCPCPPDCKPTGTCSNIGSGSLMFAGTATRITPAMQAQLATLAANMQANPDCRIVITGAGGKNKAELQRSWDRVNAVIEYMSETHNVDRNRFIFQYDNPNGTVAPNSVMYRVANEGETGPSNIEPPAPNLRRN